MVRANSSGLETPNSMRVETCLETDQVLGAVVADMTDVQATGPDLKNADHIGENLVAWSRSSSSRCSFSEVFGRL